MKTIEFLSEINEDSISVPPETAKHIPKKQKVKVTVMYSDDENDDDWENFVASEMLRQYGDEDSIYDNYK